MRREIYFTTSFFNTEKFIWNQCFVTDYRQADSALPTGNIEE